MNYNKILAIGFIGLALFSSCADDLDKEPKLNLTDKEIFADSQHIESNLLGIYGSAKSIIGLRLFNFNVARGDEFINQSVNTNEAIASYEMTVGQTTSDNTETWTKLYQTINNANTFLEKINDAKEIAGDNYGKWVAEAKFVRALSYYYLNSLYAQPYLLNKDAKSVPLRLKSEDNTGNNNLKRSTVAEIDAQILEDLSDENINNLPAAAGTYDAVTRTTQGAAHVLRQRIYMEQGQWDKAIEEGLAVKGYSLEGDISNLFKSPFITNETIFSFPMSETNRGSRQSAPAYYFYDGTRFVIDYTSGILSKAGYSITNDARVKELTGKVGTQPISTKFKDSQNYLDWTPVFRYAEVLLNLAESYYQNGDEPSARKYLNEVRRRSVKESDDVIDISSLTREALKTAIYNERRAEFIGEGIRSLDIHRRGEDFIKQGGTVKEIHITPATNGYIWPIPTIESSANKLIEE